MLILLSFYSTNTHLHSACCVLEKERKKKKKKKTGSAQFNKKNRNKTTTTVQTVQTVQNTLSIAPNTLSLTMQCQCLLVSFFPFSIFHKTKVYYVQFHYYNQINSFYHVDVPNVHACVPQALPHSLHPLRYDYP